MLHHVHRGRGSYPENGWKPSQLQRSVTLLDKVPESAREDGPQAELEPERVCVEDFAKFVDGGVAILVV